jgi:hypothetical protein
MMNLTFAETSKINEASSLQLIARSLFRWLLTQQYKAG